jgi:hypothetical protein
MRHTAISFLDFQDCLGIGVREVLAASSSTFDDSPIPMIVSCSYWGGLEGGRSLEASGGDD